MAMIAISGNLPNQIFKFNRAMILIADDICITKEPNPDTKYRLADKSEIDDIVTIGEMNYEYINSLFDTGALCFVGSVNDSPPSSMTWVTSGNCYVRGLGFEYDYGKNGYYIFGVFTKMESRKLGFFQGLQKFIAENARKNGIKKHYCMTEYTNTYSNSLFRKLGYEPLLSVTYLKMLFVNICRVKEIKSKKSTIRIFTRAPREKVIII